MTRPAPVDESALEAIAEHVRSWAGCRPDPSHPPAVQRVVRAHVQRGATLAELVARASRLEPELMASLVRAISVPETYFFRQPEHFVCVADHCVTRLGDRAVVRAWSAGCATGEEAYSLAACLVATMAPGVRVDVLGTDLVGQSLEVARAGLYGPWSYRLSGPILYPVCGPMTGRHARVLDAVRAVTRFESHSLLHPAPGQFDVVFCRNVLLYLSTDAARAALEHIARALAPDGIAVFGTLDVAGPPQGLTRVGRADLNAFVRERGSNERVLSRRSTRPPPPATVAPSPITDLAGDQAREVTMHLRVLTSIERGDRRGAEHALTQLRRRAPDYLPGLFEQALLHVRHGERHRAVTPMRELLGRLESLPPDEMLAGPEHLPVSYYQVAARAFLSTVGPRPEDTEP
jgi:chemotaxis methyl-accepting protein methylase